LENVDLPFHNEPAQLRSIFPIDWTIFPGQCVRVCNAWQFRAVCVCVWVWVWEGKTYLDDESQKFGLINVCGSGIGVRVSVLHFRVSFFIHAHIYYGLFFFRFAISRSRHRVAFLAITGGSRSCQKTLSSSSDQVKSHTTHHPKKNTHPPRGREPSTHLVTSPSA